MEILQLLGFALLAVVAFFLLKRFVNMFGSILIGLLPGLGGIALGVFIWIHGHDNIGAIVAVAGVAGNFWWVPLLSSRWRWFGDNWADNWSEDEPGVRIWDKDGNIIGYKDKE